MPQSFLDPLVPGDYNRSYSSLSLNELKIFRHLEYCFFSYSGVLVELAYLGCRESYAPDIKSAALSTGQAPVAHGAQEQIPGISSTITEKSPRQTPDVRSPIAEKSTRRTIDVIPLEQAPAVRSLVAENSPDQIPIAPGTPVAYLNSSRFHEDATVAHSDILEPSFSIESIERLDALLQEVLVFSVSQLTASVFTLALPDILSTLILVVDCTTCKTRHCCVVAVNIYIH